MEYMNIERLCCGGRYYGGANTLTAKKYFRTMIFSCKLYLISNQRKTIALNADARWITNHIATRTYRFPFFDRFEIKYTIAMPPPPLHSTPTHHLIVLVVARLSVAFCRKKIFIQMTQLVLIAYTYRAYTLRKRQMANKLVRASLLRANIQYEICAKHNNIKTAKVYYEGVAVALHCILPTNWEWVIREQKEVQVVPTDSRGKNKEKGRGEITM